MVRSGVAQVVSRCRRSYADDLRRALDGLKAKSAVALQIERNGQLIFLAFELD
jgi:hypothetical protein